MLINAFDLHNQFVAKKINGVIHVGANIGQEAPIYHALEYSPVFWVEGDPALLKQLNDNVGKYRDQYIIDILLSDKVDTVEFNLANNGGESSSMLGFGTHSKEHPHVKFCGKVVLPTTTLDLLCQEYEQLRPCNYMNIDVQGAELMVLRGAKEHLNNVDYLYLEVNEKELYVGCALMPEIDEFLRPYGFRRVATLMTNSGWGDAFYVKV